MITDFDQTPLMSSYLIAFIISDYEYQQFNATNEFNTTQRVFTNKESIDQTSHALTESVQIVKAIENTVRIPFSLSKLDHTSLKYTVVGGMLISNKSM